jgi:hypothetical protein
MEPMFQKSKNNALMWAKINNQSIRVINKSKIQVYRFNTRNRNNSNNSNNSNNLAIK